MEIHLDLINLCKLEGLPKPIREYKFNPDRKWRGDYCWPEYKLAVEIEGGIFNKGWHQAISGMLKDIEKYNSYTLLGWSLLRFTPGQVNSGEAIRFIRTWFERKNNNGR